MFLIQKTESEVYFSVQTLSEVVNCQQQQYNEYPSLPTFLLMNVDDEVTLEC